MKNNVASHVVAFGLAVAVFLPFGGGGFAAEAPLQAEPGTLQQAYQKLLSTKIFAFGGVGFAGTTSEGEKAFHTVAASTNALELFTAVLKNGTREGQMYGLCGIRSISRQSFDAHARALASADTRIMMMSGCLASEESLSSVIARLAAGAYDLHIGVAQIR